MKPRAKVVASKILSSFEEMTKQRKVIRCSIVGAMVLSEKKVGRVFLMSGEPASLADVRQTVATLSKNQVYVIPETYKFHGKKGSGFVSSVVVRAKEKEVKTEAEVKDVKVVGSACFLDEEYSIPWRKEISPDGKTLFIRDLDLNVERILSHAIYASSSPVLRKEVSLKDVLVEVKAGEKVRFADSEGKVREGIVTAVGKDKVMLRSDGEDFEVPSGFVLEKVEVNALPEEVKTKLSNIQSPTTIEEVVEFLKVAYPEQYQKILEKLLREA